MIRNLKHNMINTNLTLEEMEMLAQTDKILRKLQYDLGSQLDMTSVETGEIISTNEFTRIRGVLGALSEYRVWQLSFNKRAGF